MRRTLILLTLLAACHEEPTDPGDEESSSSTSGDPSSSSESGSSDGGSSDESSSSTGSSSSGFLYEDHVSPCFTVEASNTACHEYCEGLDSEAAPTVCRSTNLWECAYSQLLDTCDDPIAIPGGVSQCDEPMETPTLWRCLCARNPDNPCHP